MNKNNINKERLLCKNCMEKFFKINDNEPACPSCGSLYIRRSKKVNIDDLAPGEIQINHE